MTALMPRFAATLAIAAVVLAGCASGPDIRADYDKAADFGKYRTFGFVSAAPGDTTQFKSLAQQNMQNVEKALSGL